MRRLIRQVRLLLRLAAFIEENNVAAIMHDDDSRVELRREVKPQPPLRPTRLVR